MRLDEDPPCVKFHDNMTKQRLRTVFNVSTKIARGKKAQDLVLKADNNLFSHIILVAESRKENIKDAGRRTWRMFLRTHGPTVMGIGKCWWVLTTNKQGCTCQRAWKECVSCRTHTNSICFHHWWDEPGPKNDWQQQTYTQVAELALTQVLHESVPSNRLVLFLMLHTARLPSNLLKDWTGCRQHCPVYKNLAGGHGVQRWRKFLCSPSNKTSLIRFLVEQWKLPQYRQMLQRQDIVRDLRRWKQAGHSLDVVIELLACTCVHSCTMPSCTCLSNGLTCADMCRVQNCSNQQVQDEVEAVFELGEWDDEQFDEWHSVAILTIPYYCGSSIHWCTEQWFCTLLKPSNST